MLGRLLRAVDLTWTDLHECMNTLASLWRAADCPGLASLIT